VSLSHGGVRLSPLQDADTRRREAIHFLAKGSLWETLVDEPCPAFLRSGPPEGHCSLINCELKGKPHEDSDHSG